MDCQNTIYEDVGTSNHTSIESLPQNELLTPLEVQYKPVLMSQSPERQIPSQPVLAGHGDAPNICPARSTSLPPHSKSGSAYRNPGVQRLVQLEDNSNMTRAPSPRHKVFTNPQIPTYEQFPDIPSHLEEREFARYGAGRSGSDPSCRMRQHGSTTTSPQKADIFKREGSAAWARRLKEAMKGFFRKNPIDDSQFERIEDRHWTE